VAGLLAAMGAACTRPSLRPRSSRAREWSATRVSDAARMRRHVSHLHSRTRLQARARNP
jgi:hypothetical protein